MTFADVRAIPTIIDTGPNGGRFHHSVLRSHHCLEKVRELLGQQVPHAVILELIDDMMNAPQCVLRPGATICDHDAE